MQQDAETEPNLAVASPSPTFREDNVTRSPSTRRAVRTLSVLGLRSALNLSVDGRGTRIAG